MECQILLVLRLKNVPRKDPENDLKNILGNDPENDLENDLQNDLRNFPKNNIENDQENDLTLVNLIRMRNCSIGTCIN